ncbi:hypothetical protein [Paracoccus salsus]|uniref:hypothetical protein n=1 Tax=Paracoccus salsus TaxID=2911061 RepID=UPI001F1B8511|nr:hypothetical protein [Paracoccus salsus]MCF3974660.1 hypothetical protein [Paracoccus salsus]
MTEIANPGLLNLQALHVDGSESHPREGVHVRVAHHPLLGMPTMPFVLERFGVTRDRFERLSFRTDAIWRDKAGNPLAPPFAMDHGDEVTVTLPTGTGIAALWAEIIADPGAPKKPDRPIPTPRAFATAMQVEAFQRSATGSATSLGTRSEPPFAFSGPGIVRLVIRGNGTVVGIRWLDADRLLKSDWQTSDVLNLPHAGGRRYIALSDWQALCKDRVDAQVPLRRPMQDLASALPRFSAPGHPPAEEFRRVLTLFEGIDKPLDRLLTDLVPQHQQVTRHKLTHADGVTNILPDNSAEASAPTLGLVLQGQTDPGLGSWMGYKTLDLPRDDTAFRLSFYRVTGFFRNPTNDVLTEGGFLFALLVAAARNQHGLKSQDMLFRIFLALAGNWLGARGITARADPLTPFTGFDMGALAVADHRAPLDPITAPVMGTPRHVAWLPAPAAAPIRSTETDIDGVPAAGALAVQMRQPQGSGPWRTLNAEKDIGAGRWRTLILPSAPSSDPNFPSSGPPTQTLIANNRTGPDGFTIHAANMDRFGRYSDFAQATGAPGPRPKPPRPILLGSYAQPDMASLSHVGRVTATVPLPEQAALAPGSFPLSHAELTVKVSGTSFGPVRVLSVGSAIEIHPNASIPDQTIPTGENQPGLRLSFDGPSIPATQSRQLEMTAVWVDTAGQRSLVSEPVVLTMTDPYPPAQIPIPDVLDYAARPDATGTAWVERDIPGSASQRHAVYYADENRLRDHLRRSTAPADATLLAQLEAEPDPAARATLLRGVQARFPATLFERLENAVETVPILRFRHGLPGTLRVLSAYKVAVESAANAAGPDLTTLDTVFYAVPNSDPPARPSVRVRLVPPQAGEPPIVAEVTVALRAGLTEGAVARIRRTRSGVVDPLRNPVVATVAMGPVDPVSGLQTATFRDIGSAVVAPSARLAAFVNYAWLAEVQGAPEPGSVASASGAVPGLWSEPSPPATLTLVPDAPPVAPTLVGGTSIPAPGGRRDIRIDFTYPHDLTPGSPGPWRIRVERAEPDAGLSLVSEDPAPSGTAFAVQSGATEVLPVGTRYRVRLIDPVGRNSPAVEHIV